MVPAVHDVARHTSRARAGVALVPRLVTYHLRLLSRNPTGAFISLIIPLMLLVALDLVTPEMTLRSLGSVPVAQFLTPAMASFAILNVGFVDVVISLTLARDEGTLRRFRCSPLPTWVYLAGRLATAVVIGALAVAAVVAVGIGLLHAQLDSDMLWRFVATGGAGLLTSFALALAVSVLVPSALAALPIAYGLLLPVAFISQVFFPAPTEARWLRFVAGILPIQPIANGMEACFSASTSPLQAHGLVVLGCWTLGGLVVGLVLFSSEPRARLRTRLLLALLRAPEKLRARRRSRREG